MQFYLYLESMTDHIYTKVTPQFLKLFLYNDMLLFRNFTYTIQSKMLYCMVNSLLHFLNLNLPSLEELKSKH